MVIRITKGLLCAHFFSPKGQPTLKFQADPTLPASHPLIDFINSLLTFPEFPVPGLERNLSPYGERPFVKICFSSQLCGPWSTWIFICKVNFLRIKKKNICTFSVKQLALVPFSFLLQVLLTFSILAVFVFNSLLPL